MKKLQLNLESLTVTTFATNSDEEVVKGTVHALQTTMTGCDCGETQPLYLTCDVTCSPSAGEPTCQTGDINC